MSSLRMSTPLFMYTVVNYFPTIFFRDIEKMSSLRISTPLFMYTVVNYFPTISFRDIEKMSQQQQQSPKHAWTLQRTIFNNEYLIIFCFIIVIAAITVHVKRLKLCPKRSDLSHVPSMSYFMTEEDQSEPGIKFSNAYQYP